MRKIILLICILLPLPLFAESVFLKNGNILEGTLGKESNTKITLKLKDGQAKELDRKDILRILYHEDYKGKRLVTKVDGTTLNVYIVDEDKNNYIFRTDLNSPNEVKISRNDVDSISKPRIIQKYLKDNGNGTLTDTRTGLIWLKNADSSKGDLAMSNATTHCKISKFAGYSDWRMGTKEEMEKLFDGMPRGISGIEYFTALGFENVQGTYWSSTFSNERYNLVWVLSLLQGKMTSYDWKTAHIFVLPVRGNSFSKRNTDDEQKLKKNLVDYIESLNPEDRKIFYKEFTDALEKTGVKK